MITAPLAGAADVLNVPVSPMPPTARQVIKIIRIMIYLPKAKETVSDDLRARRLPHITSRSHKLLFRAIASHVREGFLARYHGSASARRPRSRSKRSRNAFASSGSAKQSTTQAQSSRSKEYVSGAADRHVSPIAAYLMAFFRQGRGTQLAPRRVAQSGARQTPKR